MHVRKGSHRPVSLSPSDPVRSCFRTCRSISAPAQCCDICDTYWSRGHGSSRCLGHRPSVSSCNVMYNITSSSYNLGLCGRSMICLNCNRLFFLLINTASSGFDGLPICQFTSGTILCTRSYHHNQIEIRILRHWSMSVHGARMPYTILIHGQ